MTKINTKMNVSDKLKLRSLPRSRCTKCKSFRTYQNPMAKCWECRKKFCFSDINLGQINNTMKEKDEVRNICDWCKKEYKYVGI